MGLNIFKSSTGCRLGALGSIASQGSGSAQGAGIRKMLTYSQAPGIQISGLIIQGLGARGGGAGRTILCLRRRISSVSTWVSLNT